MRHQHSKIAAVCFLLLIPGYFAYHAMAGQGLFSLAVGGYMTQVSLPMLPVLFWVYSSSRHSVPRPQLDLAFFSFVALFLAIVGIHLLLGVNEYVARTHVSVAIQFLVIFFVSRLSDPLDTSFRGVILLSFAALTGVVYSFTSNSTFEIAVPEVVERERQLTNYQGYAFVYALLVMYCAATTRSRRGRLAIYLLGIPALFFINARSEFLGILLAVPLIEFCYARNRTLFVLTLGGVVAAAAGSVTAAVALLPDTNRVRLLLRIAEDQSVAIRLESIERAIRTIRQYPLLGDYGSYPPGHWAHNLLSAWVDLGLLGFVLFCALLFVPLLRLIVEFQGSAREPLFVLCFTVVSFTIALSLTAKSFAYLMVPLSVGLCARRRMLMLDAARQVAATSARH